MKLGEPVEAEADEYFPRLHRRGPIEAHIRSSGRAILVAFLAFTGEAPLKPGGDARADRGVYTFLAFTGEAPLKPAAPTAASNGCGPFLAFTGEAPLKQFVLM